MKFLMISLLFLSVSLLNALTVEEFIQLESTEQLSVLSNRPDKKINRLEDLLKLYSAGLSAESTEVQRAAAQASGLLMSGLQSADPSQIPDFPEEDTRLLQQRLLSALESEDKYTRMGAAEGLAYSSIPDAQIKNLLLKQFENEVDAESKISILAAMGIAGYKSNDIAIGAVSLLEGTEDIDLGHAGHRAVKLLGLLKNPSALKRLATIAQGTDPNRSKKALQAIAGYGGSAASVKDSIIRIMNGLDFENEVVISAQVAFRAIESGTARETGLSVMNTRELWPLALSRQSEAEEEQISSVAKSPRDLEPKSEAEESTVPEPATEKPIEVATFEPSEEPVELLKKTPEQSSQFWPWLIGVVVILVGLGLVLRRVS